jgi:chorismate lyase / 3-hydroxybenzoate synthase
VSKVLRPTEPTPQVRRPLGGGWQAVGDVRRDLSSWVPDALNGGASAASAAVDVRGCTGIELQGRAFETYARVIGELQGHVARMWTFLPDITERDATGLDRYMHLNLGRARAYRDSGRLNAAMPAGTCVGHAGPHLVVHAIAVSEPVRAIENPRQRPAWQYSEQYGPAAPPFSRAVRTRHALWASGTASVLGERSTHAGDLEAQWAETIANLQALAASGGATGSWRCMRAYARNAGDLARVRELGARDFGAGLEQVLHAPLCRPDLLVEVEGIADA